MAWDSNIAVLKNTAGDPVPQIWDDDAQAFIVYEGVVNVDGSIPEYLWLSTDTAPTPAAGDRVLGVEINTSTHEMTVKYWTGTAWGDVA